MDKKQQPRLRPIGKIVRPAGLKGDVKIIPLVPDFENFVDNRQILIGDYPDNIRDVKLKQISQKGKLIRYEVDNIHSRTDAEELIGKTVFATVQKDEIFSEDLIGYAVETVQGELIGELIDVLHLSAHDVYVIDNGGKEVLIPAINEFVQQVDLRNKYITINSIDGLID